MTPKEFNKYLDRDFGRCWHCGVMDDTLVPQHRIGRGMGGSKHANRPSNIIVLCSYANGLMESNAVFAEVAREKGWKLASYQDSVFAPVWDFWTGRWWMLDENFGRHEKIDL